MSVNIIIMCNNIKYKSLIDLDDWLLHCNGIRCYSDGEYVCKWVNNKNVKLHRLIMNCPQDMFVDHINGNTWDNRKINLRVCTNAENSRNAKMRKDNISGYKGVGWHNKHNKWQARITINNKLIHLGYFDTAEDAYMEYCKASKQYHGVFGKT